MRSKQLKQLLQRIEILDSHVRELIELLRYNGRDNLVAGVALVGETLDQYASAAKCARCGNLEGAGIHYMGPGLIQTSAHYFEPA